MSRLSAMKDSQKYIFDLHAKIINEERDFRNYNLNKMIIRHLKGNSLLDIGCGTGYLLHLAKKNGFVCTGIEPNKDLINLGKNTYKAGRIVFGDASKVNKLGKFDTITLIDVLEHVKEDADLLTDIHNHLPENGRVIIVVPVFRFLYGKRDNFSGHYRRYSKKDLILKLKKQGFKIIKVRYWNFVSFLPYVLYEKIFKREVNAKVRHEQKGFFGKIISSLLFYWFRCIENNINLGFGLSLFVVAEK